MSEADFWTMTVGEAARACDAYQDRRRDRAYFAYTQAVTVGVCISSMFSRKSPPQMYEIYPELFPEGKEEAEEAMQAVKEAQMEANFMKMANALNKRIENNGNREPESENNG